MVEITVKSMIMINTFTNHLDLSEEQIRTLFSLNLQNLLKSPDLQEKLASLNTHILKQTLSTAGAVLAEHLPPFYEWLKYELGLERVPNSPDHTTKWVIGFLNNQESLIHLVELHRPVPAPALQKSVPRLVGLFDTIEDAEVRMEWQKAIAALCLVLAVAANDPVANAIAV
jgi:hypothetical protein